MESKAFEIKTIKRIIDSKETEKLIECVSGMELQDIPIGEGDNAFIFLPKEKSFERVCIKKVKKVPSIKINEIDKECELQAEARKMMHKKDDGNYFSVPQTLLSFTTKDGEMYLVMERVDGYSIKDILINPELLPKKFDYQVFCKDLDERTFLLHGKSTGDGIHHRDLHEGNIMINMEGLPVFIDFGAAIKGSGSEETYNLAGSGALKYNPQLKRYTDYNKYLDTDLVMIEKLKEKLKSIIV